MQRKILSPTRVAWLFLLGAVVFEVGGTSIMKLSQSGAWLIGPQAGLAVMFGLIALSYYCLALAVRGLAVGVAFAFWEGLGLALITLVSTFALGEAMTVSRFLALLAVLGGAMLIHHGTVHDSEDHQADAGGASVQAGTPGAVGAAPIREARHG